MFLHPQTIQALVKVSSVALGFPLVLGLLCEPTPGGAPSQGPRITPLTDPLAAMGLSTQQSLANLDCHATPFRPTMFPLHPTRNGCEYHDMVPSSLVLFGS